ncbi:uncharacterized protein LOC126368068 [Pectinophora gossypiella]|uniref:uncharacterized protein LOC126368068 n=1 Tax=Pectinophora gossypiella TaxID=13191 RepID=UPI00214F384A|nr:uncharacterized protein LOC126368068 [Pectinophora gossypiella]XP_049867904.1 uncharacterized protein LOC126368068 [Pectinophora gossypiella]
MMTPIFTLLYSIITLALFSSVQSQSPLNLTEIDEDVDSIFKSELGNVPVVRPDFPPPPPFISEKHEEIIEKKIQRRAFSQAKMMATPHPTIPPPPLPPNISQIIRERVRAREIDYIVRRSTNYLINLQNDVDEIDEISGPIITRRQQQPTRDIIYNYNRFWYWIDTFKQTREKVRHAFKFKNPDNLDYPFFPDLFNATGWTLEKNRTISIMHNWVYRTRFNLLYSQRMRKKYILSIRYKLGYCFALLRQLKREQRLLFNGYLYSGPVQGHLYYHLKIYEKVVRLDVDMKDLIKFIKGLELSRKKTEQPDFYTDFPSSSGTKWG